MRRRCGAVGVVLVLMATAGCGSSGSGRGGDWSHPAASSPGLISGSAAMRMGYTPRWATDLGLKSADRIVASVILDDLLITITQPRNLVAATSMRTGQTQWIRQLGGELEQLYGATRWNDRLFINSGSRIFEVDPHTGEHHGTAQLARLVAGGPTLHQDRAIFGAVDGTVFAHSFTTGRERWQYAMTAQIHTPPILVGDAVFAADGKGTYALLDADTGALRWVGRSFDSVTAPPGVDRASLYIASHDNFLYAVDRTTGEDKWKFPATQPLIQGPVALGLGVYLPLPGKALVALDAVDGREPRWTLQEPATPITTLGNHLLALGDDGLLLIEVDTGRIVHRIPTRSLRDVLVGPEDSLILMDRHGRITRLDPA